MPTIGILALQGAVEEHVDCMKKLGCKTREIKTTDDLDGLDGIVLPGGESTAMAIIGEKGGLFSALKMWVSGGRPIWGTCAGMILLSDHAIKQAIGGQILVGGLDVHVCRNYFGSQVYSCEYDIQDIKISDLAGSVGIFIRAPAILKCGPGVEILGTVNAAPHASALKAVQDLLVAAGPDSHTSTTEDANLDPATHKAHTDETMHPEAAQTTNFVASLQSHTSLRDAGTGEQHASGEHVYRVAVAVRQGNILATAFHPELSGDLRWHKLFLEMVEADTP